MRAMKDSGVEWIGRIPEDWKVYKVKQIIVRNDGGIWGNDPTFHDTDVIVLRSTEQTIDGKWDLSSPALRDLGPEENYSEYILMENDLLITKSSGSELHIGKTTIVDKEVADQRCCFSNFMQRIRAKSSVSARILWYYFNSIILREQFCYFSNTTSGLNNINASMINNASISLPSFSGQLRIITFLDAKCAQIDAIIEKQQQIIEKLKEYKQSVITEAVTKGLDPTVPMKDSGVEWIGKVPVNWDIGKTLFALSMAITDGPHETPDLFDSGIPFISAEAISGGEIDFSHMRGFISEEYYQECCKKYIPQLEDIYMIKSGATTGRVAMVKTTEIFTIWSPLAVFRCNRDRMLPQYLYFLLKSDAYLNQVENKWSYGTQQNIGMRALEKLLVCFPPLEIQRQIGAYLVGKCDGIDTIIEKKEQAITKLAAYKKSLIYEAVTGKMEV